MRILLVLMFLSILAGFSGCGSHAVPDASTGILPYPQRIVCATPGLAEVVFRLGAGDRVVGVSDYTVWPAEALSVPKIGGWMNPDRERLLALQPDLILTQGLHEPLAQFAARNGIRLEQIRTDTLADVIAQFAIVGELIGASDKAQAIQASLVEVLDATRAAVAGLAPQRVVLILERPEGVMRNLTTVGPNTFLSELLVVAGGENLFSDVVGDYPQISREALLVRAPEVIVELHSAPVAGVRKQKVISDWQVMSSIPAVREARIVFLAGDYVLIPGPRIVETVRQLAQALHPEVF